MVTPSAQDDAPVRDGAESGPGLHLASSVPSPRRRHKRSSSRVAEAPDLGALAREAVAASLREATAATTGLADAPAGHAAGDGAGDTLSRLAAGSEEWTVAAAGAVVLDRIELAAAKIEADIAAAYKAQGDLQARAGIAAETAVHAAQAPWLAGNTSVQAESRGKAILRKIEYYLKVTITLVAFVAILLAISGASPA
jgi:hypothetical protein